MTQKNAISKLTKAGATVSVSGNRISATLNGRELGAWIQDGRVIIPSMLDTMSGSRDAERVIFPNVTAMIAYVQKSNA
jgi:hypothetical protein